MYLWLNVSRSDLSSIDWWQWSTLWPVDIKMTQLILNATVNIFLVPLIQIFLFPLKYWLTPRLLTHRNELHFKLHQHTFECYKYFSFAIIFILYIFYFFVNRINNFVFCFFSISFFGFSRKHNSTQLNYLTSFDQHRLMLF